MTSVSNDLPAQPAVRPAAGKQTGRKDSGGFDDALKAADGRPKERTDQRVTDEPRWPGLIRKLDTAIAPAGRGVAADAREQADGENFEPADDTIAADTDVVSKEEAKAEGAGLSMSVLQFPPVHLRRLAMGSSEDRSTAPADADSDNTDILREASSKIDARREATVEPQDRPQGDQKAGKASLDQGAGRARQLLGDRTEKPADPVDSARPTARAAVLSEQNFAAPTAATGAVLAQRIAAEIVSVDVAGKTQSLAVHTPTAPASAHSLKIQLHPAELGMVTASLRLAGEQLSVELHVESQEAYQRLSADSETIMKSLRGLGYEIDKVTILPPNVVVNAPARAESDASISNQAPRGGETFGSDRGNGSGSRNSGGSRNDAQPNNSLASPGGRRDDAGDSLYI